MRFPPANLQLRRAQLILMLAVLLPSIAMTGIGIVLLFVGYSSSLPTLISGALILTFCTSVITGIVLGSIFLGKGASLARVQNDFVASVSHELRTPLTSIRLLIESLNNNRLGDDDRPQVLSLLGREADRLEALVGRVLALSRLQSSSHVWPRHRIEVGALIDEAIAAFDASTLAKPTKVVRELEPGLTVVGDRATLVPALVNLLVNAWKYTGEDKQIALEVRQSRRWIELTVRDNGVGIDGAEKRAIFEQFARGRAAHETGAPGIGLGLAFVFAIVRGHRGKLDVWSGGGTTEFTIRLRRRRRARETSAAIVRAPTGATA
jgi:two-component system phosphate regulon sensor histidine kinase PhoR